jgi:cytochrome b561
MNRPLPILRYTRVAITLHWVIAGLIAFNLLGFIYLRAGASGTVRGILSPVHASSGLTVLLLTLVRFAWRMTHSPPPHGVFLHHGEIVTARLVHLLLYAAMILMPITGWALVSAHPPEDSAGMAYADAHASESRMVGKPALRRKPPLRFWGVAPLPLIQPIEQMGKTPRGVVPQKKLHDVLDNLHRSSAFLFAMLLGLHILGALKHELFDGYPQLSRMGVRFHRRR